MTHIAFESSQTPTINPLGAAFIYRLRVLARAHRRGRVHRARLRLINSEMRDPRWFADIGLDAERRGRHDWIREMARAMGGV